MTVDEARAALNAAEKARNEASRQLAAEIDAVRAEHVPAILEAQNAVNAAAQALREAENAATPDHEWEGKTVCRTVDLWRNGRVIGEIHERGVVFTYRHGIDLGPGWPLTNPQLGEPIVGLLRKDGKRAVRTVRLDNELGGPWTLETTHD